MSEIENLLERYRAGEHTTHVELCILTANMTTPVSAELAAEELSALRARLERAEKIEAAINAKVAEWRKKSNDIDVSPYDYGAREKSDTLDDCANELAAVLEAK